MLVTLGMWAWGGATVLLAVLIFGFVFVAAFMMKSDGKFDCPRMGVIYKVLKDHGTLVAAVLGASALGWSYFFTVVSHGN